MIQKKPLVKLFFVQFLKGHFYSLIFSKCQFLPFTSKKDLVTHCWHQCSPFFCIYWPKVAIAAHVCSVILRLLTLKNMYLSIHKHISHHQVNSKKSDITKTILKIEVLTPTTEESSEERTTLLISLTLYSKVFPPSFGLIF